MKNLTLIMLLVFSLTSIAIVNQAGAMHAPGLLPNQSIRLSNNIQQAAATASPATQPATDATPADRVLPPVGSNAGLMLGAAVLVLIIISGVIISSRWRGNH